MSAENLIRLIDADLLDKDDPLLMRALDHLHQRLEPLFAKAPVA